ncbi:MAG: hypothetical protein H6882_05330 [Rhodobiaceae bacterium]|nr:hypothetical protein [Rhodobiaceae bacterium]
MVFASIPSMLACIHRAPSSADCSSLLPHGGLRGGTRGRRLSAARRSPSLNVFERLAADETPLRVDIDQNRSRTQAGISASRTNVREMPKLLGHRALIRRSWHLHRRYSGKNRQKDLVNVVMA